MDRKEAQEVLTDSPWAGKGSLTDARAGDSAGQVRDLKLTVTRTALPIREDMVRKQIGQGGNATPEQHAMLTGSESHYIMGSKGCRASSLE